jgi:hypothetical protein
VIVFSFITIKVKSRRSKKGMFDFSNPSEGKIIMSEGDSTIVNHKSELFLIIKHHHLILDVRIVQREVKE